MPLETSYPGIYRGFVVDTNDPLNANRVRLIVPQISGTEITNWAWPISGTPMGSKTPYASAYDTTNQPASQPGTANSTVTNTAKVITLNTFSEGYGISIKDGSKLTFSYKGLYNIQFSAQFVSTNSSLAKVQIWLAKNGVNLSQTSGVVTLSGTGAATLPAWNYVLNLKANDYLQLYWASDAPHVYLGANPVSLGGAPDTPSVILTAVLESGYLPSAADPCWVMFEGGDPNFPLWLGTF